LANKTKKALQLFLNEWMYGSTAVFVFTTRMKLPKLNNNNKSQ